MKRFFTWFDYKVWYPLGRPVGTTIYPGMQFTAVFLKNHILPDWSLNDVCVYMPAIFGVVATAIVGLITYESSIPINTQGTLWSYLAPILHTIIGTSTTTTGSTTHTSNNQGPGTPENEPKHSWSPAMECALFATALMSIVPAHLMRSMGGGFDNESVAVTAMVATFYFWIRSLRNDQSWPFAFGAALSYFYMVASWGGYIFVLNLVGLHAAVLVLLGRLNTKVWAAYSIFYFIGTILAIQVPVVGWSPLKSLEQLGPCAVFVAYQLLYAVEYRRTKLQLSREQAWKLRFQVFAAAAVALFLFVLVLVPKGYFGPLSARVRGLFVKHTKTGNPLVDSVAEHQPASNHAYFQYLHHACTLAPIGFVFVLVGGLSDTSSFLLVWALTTYFFSHKMVRLILLTAPIASILGGIAAGRLLTWCIHVWWNDLSVDPTVTTAATETASGTPDASTAGTGSGADAFESPGKKSATKGKKKSTGMKRPTTESSRIPPKSLEGLALLQDTVRVALRTSEGIMAQRSVALIVVALGCMMMLSFIHYCWLLSNDLANPTIIIKARTRTGEIIYADDYRESYWWLRDNTPEDARVMAWWDYGYQISAISNRTTIADGNTWNHEHIALLGKALTTDLDQGWEIARHLADYVLVWGGGGGDDLAKSPHLARIANSVYRDHCPDDPTCRAFGFLDRQGTPSAMMERSLLFRLHSHKLRPGVEAPADKFREVYQSKYGKVRIFQVIGVDEDSKAWVSDPANLICDAPGSWFCPGQYPPALNAILSKKRDFSQLEDFNKEKKQDDDEYFKKYFEHLNNPDTVRRQILEKERRERKIAPTKQDDPEFQATVKKIYSTWEDTEDTTRMWQLISTNNVNELKLWLESEPEKAFIRSKDGRGPMFWAFEQRSEEITKILMRAGVPHIDKDARGLSPMDLLM